MKEMTEEEAEYWDEYYTNNTIMPDLSKPGYFSQKYGISVKLDPKTTCTLATQAQSVHQTPAEIIADLVREKFTGTAEAVI